MTNILLTLILIANLAFFVFFFLQMRKVQSAYEQFIAFVTPAEEGKASPLAELVETIASTFARAIVMQAKATFMGQRSGEVRQAKAEAGTQAEMAIDSSPAAGIIDAIPGMRRGLRKNPGLIDLALPFLQRAMMGGPGMGGGILVPKNGQSGAGDRPRFKF